MIFDTHCHYNLEPLFSEWQNHWQKAQAMGVRKSMVIGTSLETSQLAQKIAKTDKNLWAAIALHPGEFAPEMKEEFIEDAVTELRKILVANTDQKIVAIGETGLDYFHLSRTNEFTEEQKTHVRELQQSSLRKHFSLATECDLPIILHVRDVAENAYEDVLKILSEENFTGTFVLHCASGPTAYIQRAVKLGAYVSFAANCTYKNAEHLRELVRCVPRDKILAETDAPFLPPQEFRGKTCEPWMITKTVEFLENELAINPQDLWQNAHDFLTLEKVE